MTKSLLTFFFSCKSLSRPKEWYRYTKPTIFFVEFLVLCHQMNGYILRLHNIFGFEPTYTTRKRRIFWELVKLIKIHTNWSGYLCYLKKKRYFKIMMVLLVLFCNKFLLIPRRGSWIVDFIYWSRGYSGGIESNFWWMFD